MRLSYSQEALFAGGREQRLLPRRCSNRARCLRLPIGNASTIPVSAKSARFITPVPL